MKRTAGSKASAAPPYWRPIKSALPIVSNILLSLLDFPQNTIAFHNLRSGFSVSPGFDGRDSQITLRQFRRRIPPGHDPGRLPGDHVLRSPLNSVTSFVSPRSCSLKNRRERKTRLLPDAGCAFPSVNCLRAKAGFRTILAGVRSRLPCAESGKISANFLAKPDLGLHGRRNTQNRSAGGAAS